MTHVLPVTKISIVVPVGRHSLDLSNLRETLNLNLSHSEVEFIIVEDSEKPGSNPSLKALAEDYAGQRVSILNGDFNNPGSARNFGETKCSGEWILYWDCDDLGDIKPFLLEELNSTADILVASYNLIDLISGSITKIETDSLLQLAINPGLWRVAFRRSTIKHLRFTPISMAEDQVFLAQCLATTGKIKFINKVAYSYFVGNQNQLTSKKEKMNDLKKSLRAMNFEISASNSEYIQFYIILLEKQLISSIKYAKTRAKIESALIFLSVLLSNFNPKFAREIFPATINLLRDKYKKDSHKVYMSLTGGMGNQLFQIAAGLYFSAGKGAMFLNRYGNPRVSNGSLPSAFQFKFDSAVQFSGDFKASWFWKKCAGYVLRRGIKQKRFENFFGIGSFLELFFTFCLRARLGFRYKIRKSTGVGEFIFDTPKKKTMFFGYFQTYKWLENDFVYRIMSTIHLPNSSETLEFYRLKASIENPLVIHIRLGDYISEPLIGLLPSEYFENALLEIFRQDKFGKIWLFSDEPDIAVQKIPEKYLSYTEVISTSTMTDALTLQVMRHGTGYILSNSTFGWWAAALSHSKSPQVVVPNRWFREMPEPLGLIPNHWIRCSAWPI
jgi:glycosyltransferase involved in cell wall biosynthesis